MLIDTIKGVCFVFDIVFHSVRVIARSGVCYSRIPIKFPLFDVSVCLVELKSAYTVPIQSHLLSHQSRCTHACLPIPSNGLYFIRSTRFMSTVDGNWNDNEPTA